MTNVSIPRELVEQGLAAKLRIEKQLSEAFPREEIDLNDVRLVCIALAASTSPAEPVKLEQGYCCYGGLRSRQDCASCAKWVAAPLSTSPAPAVPDAVKVNDKEWSIDHSAGRPILVLNGCSVIEAEDAEYVLSLIRAVPDAAKPDPLDVPGEGVYKTPSELFDTLGLAAKPDTFDPKNNCEKNHRECEAPELCGKYRHCMGA